MSWKKPKRKFKWPPKEPLPPLNLIDVMQGCSCLSADAAERHRSEQAAELKRLMEAQWQRGPCAKAKGICRWIMPMTMQKGPCHGYANDICPE